MGVIYLLILPSTLGIVVVHEELETVLMCYSEDELKRAFVVVEPGRQGLEGFQSRERFG